MPENLILHRQKHIDFVEKHLNRLSSNFDTLESSRSWFCFWGLHSLRLLGHQPSPHLLDRIVRFLKSCMAPGGGYGGGPGQLPHLATTYASIMALVSVGTREALESINRKKLRLFIESLRQPNGAFIVHEGGEADIRAVYCAVASASLTGIILGDDDPLLSDTPSWIIRCQTYEGGFGAEPNCCEAHGGYTFCAIASLALLRKTYLLNADQTLRWLVNRQTTKENGFQGRTNKLVDGCYTYWQAASFFTLEYQLCFGEKRQVPVPLFDSYALQEFVLYMCQDETGGLRDKPDKLPDPYHTCYTLSGLSIAQTFSRRQNDLRRKFQSTALKEDPSPLIGGEQSVLVEIHPLYNVCLTLFELARDFFCSPDQNSYNTVVESVS